MWPSRITSHPWVMKMSDVDREMIDEWWLMGTNWADKLSDKHLIEECISIYRRESSLDTWTRRGIIYSLGLREVQRAIEAESEADRVEEGDQPS